MRVCLYQKKDSDGYGTNWTTDCGSKVRMKSPIDVGMCFAPLPNEDGKFCRYCGRKIVIREGNTYDR